MTLEELLAFKGGCLEEYQKLLNEKHALERAIRRNSIRMYDEEASIKAIGEPKNEKEKANLEKHIRLLEKAKKSLKKNQDKLSTIQYKIISGEY